ncbi:MAG TPA: WD40 repeat domain-containing protein [Kofleriaceae bacterium]|nr:WD40 repeat domain-containing protein [Kofleriaceae bacterium]
MPALLVLAAAIHALHGAELRAIAITPDGIAAATADTDGGVRLWPSLDGKREPVVIDATAAASLAIAHDGDSFAIAIRDAAGGVTLVRTSALGEAQARATIVTGRPVLAIAAVQPDFVALRDDQAIAIFDLHGTARTTLVPKEGEHVEAIVARGSNALALVTRDGKLRGRWINAASAGWGGDTPVLPLDLAFGAVLAPKGDRLAGTDKDGLISIVDLANGRVIVQAGPSDFQHGERLRAVGFAGNALAIVRDRESVGWWTDDTWINSDRLFVRNIAVASAGGDLVFAGEGSMILASPDHTRYLGYKMTEPSIVRLARHGLLLSDRGTIARTDAHLRTTGTIDVPRLSTTAGSYSQVIPIDERHAIGAGGTYEAFQIYQIDLAHPDKPVAVAAATRAEIDYEPLTHLAMWGGGTSFYFARVDPKTGELSTPVELDVAAGYPQVVLADPGRAPRALAAVITEQQNGVEVTPITAITDDVVTGKPRTRSSTISWWVQASHHDLSELGLGGALARAHGALTAELDRGRVTLRDHDAVRWTVALPSVHDLLWSGDDLVAIGGGLATLDLATGALDDRQCGWEFGLYDDVASATGGAALCTAP